MKYFESKYDGELLELINESDRGVFVLFSAEWHTGLDLVRHGLEAVSEKYRSKLDFVQMDIDECPQLVDKFNINKIPTYIIFQNGEIEDYFSGIVGKTKLEKKLLSVIPDINSF